MAIQRRTFGLVLSAAVLPAAFLVAACGSGSSPAASGATPPVPPGTSPAASEAAAMIWTGTMTGTETWSRQTYRGSASATFTGTWDPAISTGGVQPCIGPDSCIAFFPHGTIHWTWQSTIDSPACSANTSGDTAAGAGNTPASGIFGETLYLQVDPSGSNYNYWGTGSWPPAQVSCPTADVSAPPEYFDLPEATKSGTPASDSLCHEVTWQIALTATNISGSCYEYNQTGHTLQFTWNLTRSSP